MSVLSKLHSRWSISRSSITSSNSSQLQQEKTIGDGREETWLVAFLADHVVSGSKEGKIQYWRVKDGKAEGTPINAGSAICSIAVSRDSRWIVSGTLSGIVTVWNAESHQKVTTFRGHTDSVRAVDVSPDGTRIGTGSFDSTACIWSLSTGLRQHMLKYDGVVIAVKFSGSQGFLLAIATSDRDSVQIYDYQSNKLLVDVSIKVNSVMNQSLVWASDSKTLYVLSGDGNINSLDLSGKTTHARWPIHSSVRPTCITLSSDGRIIAASASSSISFWDPTTHQQIGQVIKDGRFVQSMTMSLKHGLATGGGKAINIHSLIDVNVSPSPRYDDQMSHEEEIESLKAEDSILKEVPNEEEESPEQIVQELPHEPITSQREAELSETIDSLRADLREREESSNREIQRLAKAVQELRTRLICSEDIAKSLGQIINAHERRHECEALYANERVIDAAISLLDLTNTVSEEARANKSIGDWLLEFTDRCISKLETIGDEALSSENREEDEAIKAYSVALSLGPSAQNTLLMKWASVMLIHGSSDKALGAAAKFKLPMFVVYQAICDVLERDNRVTEAIKCFRQLQSEPSRDTNTDGARAQWELDFRGRCVEKLGRLGDTAMSSNDHDKAIQQYSDALTLDPSNQNILLKRSEARSLLGLWSEALDDAAEVIKLDPSFYKGYERKHAALHGMGQHSEAFAAFRIMLSKVECSSDRRIRDLRSRYIDATLTIQEAVDHTTRHMPRVLIDTHTGRLYDKVQLAAAFGKLPIYDEMRSSMTTRLDHTRILGEVKQYYQYVMFSHRWENGEPLYQKVENMSIYELELTSANAKLQKLCRLSRSLGFQWVWSDTCCIDRKDSVVLQESLVAMFTWYRGSSLTIVYLRGVRSDSQRYGDLRASDWNTRGWTYQEYVAAEIVQFYTEDWKPYLGLDMFNHKESPAIISEMQQDVGSITQERAILRPGLERVREKLYLASERQTTLVEDIAYSLFGIFNVAIPVIYGEGNRAVGRLLEHILTGSGDVTVLAWTGRPGSYNSCLPVDLKVYSQLAPPHIPPPIQVIDMTPPPDPILAVTLYNRLNDLPSPSLAASRLRLPAIVFRLTEPLHTSELDPGTNRRVYHATTAIFGDIKFETTYNLTGTNDLCLVHPWIRPLFNQEFSQGAAMLDRTTQAIRFVARLRQRFGALLLQPLSSIEYRRVAADSLIMVQVREEVSLTDFIENIRMIEIH